MQNIDSLKISLNLENESIECFSYTCLLAVAISKLSSEILLL